MQFAKRTAKPPEHAERNDAGRGRVGRRRHVTCTKCKVAMKQTRGIHHNKRKFVCPRCKRVRMQRNRER